MHHVFACCAHFQWVNGLFGSGGQINIDSSHGPMDLCIALVCNQCQVDSKFLAPVDTQKLDSICDSLSPQWPCSESLG